MPFSVIIPALNEAGNIAATIASVRRQGPCQIIVVDGGSDDDTEAAAAAADLVLVGQRGRAVQMNTGAAQARNDRLLFLHADCQLEEGALAEAEAILKRANIAAGCFTMHVPLPGLIYRCIEGCATARVRWTGFVYGDQGLFLRRNLFEQIGGFPPLRFLEDVFLSRQLRKRGRLAVAQARIVVSPRRWQQVGVLRQTLRNWTLTALAALGVHPDQLARWYPMVR